MESYMDRLRPITVDHSSAIKLVESKKGAIDDLFQRVQVSIGAGERIDLQSLVGSVYADEILPGLMAMDDFNLTPTDLVRLVSNVADYTYGEFQRSFIAMLTLVYAVKTLKSPSQEWLQFPDLYLRATERTRGIPESLIQGYNVPRNPLVQMEASCAQFAMLTGEAKDSISGIQSLLKTY
ncbi:MAG: hypothetical protein ACMG6E_08590, partial [Candidatus Roizmanbacteria bacterium]